MSKVNLHIHSKLSLDGSLTINDIIDKCITIGISYISITDHDNCDTYKELKTSLHDKQCTLIYGIEADAIIGDITYDILCYGFNIDNVSKWAKEQYGTIETRQTKIYNKLVELCKESKIELDNKKTYIPSEEFAHTAIFRMIKNADFFKKYNISSVNEFYRLSTMDKNFPLYINMNIVWPTIDTLSKVIHDNGGKIFLAHPYKYAKGLSVAKLLDTCSSYIDGIEICNEPKNEAEVKHLYDYAKKNNLLISAGSDFHSIKRNETLNTEFLNDEMINDIKEWIQSVPGKVEL